LAVGGQRWRRTDMFIDFVLTLKRNAAGRFQRWLEEAGTKDDGETTTDWEQREHFDFV
jgi:glutamine synthetase